MSIESRLAELGLSLPPASKPQGLYRPLLVVDRLAFTSGHLPVRADGSLVTGRVGDDLDLAAGQEAARLAGLAILSTLKQGLGSLDRIVRLVKLLGIVNCPAEFTQQPAVINGCSELLRDLLGEERGIGARSAMGAGSLPLGVAVEIEAVFEVSGQSSTRG